MRWQSVGFVNSYYIVILEDDAVLQYVDYNFLRQVFQIGNLRWQNDRLIFLQHVENPSDLSD